MPRKPYAHDPSIVFICTICGSELKPKETERKQIRWTNKNTGVCQPCVIHLRSIFKTQSSKSNPQKTKTCSNVEQLRET
jgi:hypothetical protein